MSITPEYKDEMTRMHEKDWGHTAVRFGAGSAVIALLDRPVLAINTVLDFGCGTGTLGDHIAQERPGRVIWSQYDPGMKGIDKMPSGPYDLVVTCDVLEHVEPHLLVGTIQQCASLSDRVVYHNIPCYPTGSSFIDGPYKGMNIHLTVEEPKFWKRLLRDNMPEFTIAEVLIQEKSYSHGIKTRVMITSERIAPSRNR